MTYYQNCGEGAGRRLGRQRHDLHAGAASSKATNQKYCLVVSLFSVFPNACSEFRRGLSKFFASRTMEDLFYAAQPKLTPLGVERLCESVTGIARISPYSKLSLLET
jgi:hypothetical protein